MKVVTVCSFVVLDSLPVIINWVWYVYTISDIQNVINRLNIIRLSKNENESRIDLRKNKSNSSVNGHKILLSNDGIQNSVNTERT